MIERFGIVSLTAACLLPVGAAGAAESLRIGWNDLLPPGGAPAQQKIRPTPSPAAGEVTPAMNLDGRSVELSGYLLPADREGDLVYAFMLVPRAGACAHMTQPPPAQVVRVVPQEPYRLSMNYEPVTVTGEITPELEKTQLFILDGVAVIESGYRVSMARVTRADPKGGVRPASPWGRLENRRGE